MDIKFTTQYPAYHSKAGQHTFFVQKVLKSQNIDPQSEEYWQMLLRMNRHLPTETIVNWYQKFINVQMPEMEKHLSPKIHTLRIWKKDHILPGQKFVPKAWSDKPYNSHPIQFAPKIEVKSLQKLRFVNGNIMIDLEKYIPYNNIAEMAKIARNDGLLFLDFREWFKGPNYPEDIITIIHWTDHLYLDNN